MSRFARLETHSRAVPVPTRSRQVVSQCASRPTAATSARGGRSSSHAPSGSMRVIVSSAYGTWGDVSPLLQLAQELVHNDHQA